jgi:hypothetical protein
MVSAVLPISNLVFRTLSRMQIATTALVLSILAACAPATLPPPTVEPKIVAVDAAKEKVEGFITLFNGNNLDGWIGDTKGYVVEAVDGSPAIVCGPKGSNLLTKDEFGDFEFRFEFQLTPGANNGIALRCPPQGDPAYVGFESQILDNTADQYKGLKEWQYHGSIYGVAPATATALRPVGEWNHETITMKGRTIKVELNGVVIVDIDLDKVAPDGKTVSDHKVEGLKRTQGHIGFCGHGDRVAYRNLRVKKL